MKKDGEPFLLGVNEIDNSTGFGFRTRENHLTLQDLTRWQLAARALERYPQLSHAAGFSDALERIDDARIYDTSFLSAGTKKLVVPHVTNLHGFEGVNEEFMSNEGMSPSLLTVFSAIYGAVHICAYNFVFPTTIEAALWYVSSLHIATGAYLVFVVALVKIPDDITHRRSPNERLRVFWGWIYVILLLLFRFFIPICYLTARCFIVVEAFASLRNMPVGVYKTVAWTNFLPHL
jgi:hypothetical protein